jgi:hypothetical protein
VDDGEEGCNPKIACRLCTHSATHGLRRAYALLFFLNPYMSNGFGKVIGVVIYNAVLQNGKPLISQFLES